MPPIGPDEIAYALSALVVLSAMCLLYPHALRYADRHDGDPGIYGRIFRSITWVLKVANVLGWSLLIASMVSELTLPLDPRVIAISTALVAFGVMDMDNYLVKRRIEQQAEDASVAESGQS